MNKLTIALVIAIVSGKAFPQSSTDTFIENLTAVSSSKEKCGFTVNEQTLRFSMAAMDIQPQDIKVGGRHRAAFEKWVFKIEELTRTESQRQSYCSTIKVNLSAFFDDPTSSSPSEVNKPTKPRQPTVARADVSKAQKLLNDLGYKAGPIDGILGKRTTQSIRSFQKDIDTVVTGIVSADLLKLLEDQSDSLRSRAIEYLRAIKGKISQNWRIPENTQIGVRCQIDILQSRGGEVLNSVVSCDGGDATLRSSLENAVRKSSPLPATEDDSLFDRRVRLLFIS